MSNLNRHPVRRAAAGVLAGTLALTGAATAVGVTSASADADFAFDRLAGSDRYGTAVAIAQDTFPSGSDIAILARGDVFADALVSNYLSGATDAPILLTAPGSLPAVTRSGLQALGVDKVYIAGGFTAVSAAVESQLRSLGYTVERLSGADRYDTAEAVAAETASNSATPTVGLVNGLRTAIVGSGQAFPDVLAAGPLSAARGLPLAITRPTALPAQTADVLRDNRIQQVIVVGGTTAVSATVRAQISAITGNPNIELGGTTRFETARNIADYAVANLGFTRAHVDLARADDPTGFADALAGGPHAAANLAPILLTFPATLPNATDDYLRDNACVITEGDIFGGFAAVSAAVETAAETAARACATTPPPATPTATIAVTPDDTVTLPVTANPDTVITDNRTYTVSGLVAGTEYRATLVLAGNVNGNVFADAAPNDGLADTGNPTADITQVNGAAPTNNTGRGTALTATGGTTSSVVFVAGANGTATFVVDGDAPESVRPVVYINGGGSSNGTAAQGGTSPRLELNADDTPSEAFDLGGVTIFVQSSNQDFTITPATTQSKVASTDATTNEGRTAFTVTGLDDTKTYDVVLFPCDNVTTDANGVVTFEDDENTTGDTSVLEGDGTADDINASETGAASIESVNNQTGGATSDVVPVNGTITFTVDSEQADCAVAVLFDDTADDNDLDLNAANQPIEAFVASGDLVFLPRAAQSGGFSALVTSTDEANNRFTASTDDDAIADAVFSYDANDFFRIPGQNGFASLAQFESALTSGDGLSIDYNDDPAGTSIFDIETNTTPTPTAVAANVTNADGDATANDVVISFTPGGDTPAGTTYTVQRYTVTANGDGTCPAAVIGTNTTGPVAVTDTTNTDTTATDADRAPGCYAYTVTATSPNQGAASTSGVSNTVRVLAAASADTIAPDLTTATANEVNDGTGSTNQVRFNFNEAVTVIDVTKFTVSSGGVTFQGTSATITGNTVIVTVNGTLNDAGTDNTYTAAVAAAAVEDAAGNDNVADSVAFVY